MAVTKGVSWPYFVLLGLAVLGVIQAVAVLLYQTYNGLGVAGYQAPVFWGVYIINFVFWIGIGHAGTLISAILFLFRAKWRNAINRGAEAMTVFAVLTAALFPLIHIGRLWKFYFLIPYPNQRGPVGELQEPPAVGRLRDQYLHVDLDHLLLRRAHSRTSRSRGTGRRASKKFVYTDPGRWVGRATGATVEGPQPHGAPPGRPRDSAGPLRALGRVLGLRHVHRPGLACHDLRPLLRRRRHLRRLRHGDRRAGSRSGGSSGLEATSSPTTTSRTCRASSCSRR